VRAGIWWPAADSAKLRAAAHVWRDTAHALEAIHAASQSAAQSVVADNQGLAIDAFAAYWQKWSADNGYLPECARACVAMADGLDRYAQAVDDARRRVMELVAELATAVVIGVALSVVTVGISDVAAGAVSAGLMASAALVGVELSVVAADIAAGIVVTVAFGAVEAMAIDAAAIQPEKILLFHEQKDFSWDEMLRWGEMGAAGGFVGGAFTRGLRIAGDALPAAWSDALATPAGRLILGGVSGAGTSAFLDEVQYGEVNPLDLAAGAAGGMAGSRIGRRLGVREPGSPYEYDMIGNPGPLANMRGNPAAGFAGGRYNAIKLTEDTILYRGGAAGGGRNAFGEWFSFEPSSSAAQVRIELAVKPDWIDPTTGVRTGASPIESLYAIKVPAGTTVYVGPTSYQGGIYLGGRIQVFVPKSYDIPGVQVLAEIPLP
jgi:hypothetical protein